MTQVTEMQCPEIDSLGSLGTDRPDIGSSFVVQFGTQASDGFKGPIQLHGRCLRAGSSCRDCKPEVSTSTREYPEELLKTSIAEL